MKTSKCCFCKKEYDGYIVLLCSDIECFVMEEHIKTIYYDDNEGVCKKCRDIHFHNNNKWKVQNWFSVQLQIELALINVKKKGDKKSIEVYTKAVKSCKRIIKKAEEDPEVQAMYRKNHPAGYKEKPPKGTKCAYCDENEGTHWINDPNGEVKPETCWLVCKPCDKILELQSTSACMMATEHIFDKHGMDTKKIKDDIARIDKEIDEVAYEDGQQGASFKISVKDDGSLKVKEKRYG